MKILIIVDIPSIEDCNSPQADTVVDMAGGVTKDLTRSLSDLGYAGASAYIEECYSN